MILNLLDTKKDAPETKIVLYGFSKNGKSKVWEGFLDPQQDGTCFVRVRYGYIDGAKQESAKHVKKGKNIGRSNGTTPVEQALLDLRSLANKKRDEGYSESLDTANSVLLPMLAHSYKDNTHKVTYPAYAQPKLNGVRCLAEVVGPNKVVYKSRKGKNFETLGTFTSTICSRVPVGTILDGEVYNHNLHLNEIVSRLKRVLASRSDIESDPLEFHVYDVVINNLTFQERWQQLTQWFGSSTSKVVLVDTLLVNSFNELKEFHSRNIELGYEGTMYRKINGQYQENYRSYDLLKYKDFLEQEFEIVGGRDGEGKEEGQVIFICKTAEGKEFSVRPKGSKAVRTAWFNDLENLKGKMLTVRFQEWTEYNIPFHLRGIAIRDYE
jgi:DNA ligase-1